MTPADVTARRVAANRAEEAAGSLRRLARSIANGMTLMSVDLECGDAIIAADRAEAVGAVERLHDAMWDSALDEPARTVVASPPMQARLLASKTASPGPVLLNKWADEWDAWAAKVDP